MKRPTPPNLPRTARDMFALSSLDSLFYNAVVSFAEATGIWTFPMRCRGDVGEMHFLDRAYWMYKAARPTRRALRGSGIENYFAERRAVRAELPVGFRADKELSLSAVGDLMSHSYLPNSKGALYREVSDLIFGADISMANLECVVCPPVSRDPIFSFDVPPPLYYDAAAFDAAKGSDDKNFSFLAAACNHSLDFGEAGVDGTIRALDKDRIAFGGLNRPDEDPFRATILEHDSIRVGAVAYTFGLNANVPPSKRPHIVHRMSLNEGVAANDFIQLTRQIEHCQKEEVDFLVAHLHWGLEHEYYPIPEQLELGHHLAELGVDLIIGHHPHVIQPMELYRTQRDPHRLVPIYYSLGNLINPFSAPDSCRSGVARVALSKGTFDGDRARVYVRAAELIEVTQVVDESSQQIKLVWSQPQP